MLLFSHLSCKRSSREVTKHFTASEQRESGRRRERP